MASAFIPDNFFQRLTSSEIFGEEVPFEVDLGCGDGSFFVQMAEHYPERRFLAIERLLGRVRKVSKRCDQQGLENAKVFRVESAYAVEWLLPLNSVSRLHLLCPDPWPKTKHHKKRLVQRDFLDSLHALLTEEGEFLFKTDHPEYYEWVLEHVAAHPGFERLEWPEDAFFYPKTDFQLQWEAKGLSIHRARFRKRPLPAQS